MEVQQFRYDNQIVQKFLNDTMLWGVVGMLVGLLLAFMFLFPNLTDGISWLSFGRLRPLHTNAVIFAFVGNAIFAGVYYSTQRLLKARMFSDVLSNINFWGWQLIIVSAAITLPLGFTTSKEYAELEWPIDLAIAAVWVVFGWNLIGTMLRRRQRHFYVAIWFYLATFVTVAVLHIFNSLELPISALKSYSVYAGVQDALVQWWYGHNAVAFFLTTPFLGLMYYFLPKAAERPVFSYRLSIVHFWSLVFIYIWAGPHHLHYTALPDWAQSVGMIFSLILLAPSWGGMINGIMTLSGAWHKLRTDPILKFLIVSLSFYGMSTFEGPMMSIKTVNSLSHYTDWTIGHVHSGALGWVAYISFGAIYCLVPWLWHRRALYSQRLVEWHFWISTLGILLYITAMWVSGIGQGLMLRAFDDYGNLAYTFVETVAFMHWPLVVRMIGGMFFVSGVVIMAFNILMTIRSAKREQAALEAKIAAKLAKAGA